MCVVCECECVSVCMVEGGDNERVCVRVHVRMSGWVGVWVCVRALTLPLVFGEAGTTRTFPPMRTTNSAQALRN